MGYCSDDNFDYENMKKTTCTSGYDPQTTACCNRGMYIFWNVIIWIFLCGLCGLCIYMTVSRAKRMQRMQQSGNPGNMLNQGMVQ